MKQKAGGRKVDPVLLAQIENGVQVRDYLHEGCWIMDDIAKMIESFKQGGYKHFSDDIGAVSINNNYSNLASQRSSRHNYSS